MMFGFLRKKFLWENVLIVSFFISNEEEMLLQLCLFLKIRIFQQLHTSVHMQLLGKGLFHFSNEHMSDKWHRATAVT